jgi:L-methionine (R)-S-oxide reductase
MMQTDAALENWLRAFLTREGAMAGTVHLLQDDALSLRAAVNIPPPVVAATATIVTVR